MIFACDKNRSGKYRAGEIEEACCPLCGSEVIAKCGSVKIHHWAHATTHDCDVWSEESEWHVSIKDLFYPEECEVSLENHRADVFAKDVILEVQKSAISIDDVRKRNQFYGKYAKHVKWIYYIEQNQKIRVANLPVASQLARNGQMLMVWRSPLQRIFEAEFLYIYYCGNFYRVCYAENDLYSSGWELGSSVVDVYLIWVTQIDKENFARSVRESHIPFKVGENTGMYKKFIEEFGGI